MNGVDLTKEFTALFENAKRHYGCPGNVGAGCKVVSLCRTILEQQEPLLYSTLIKWGDKELKREKFVIQSFGRWPRQQTELQSTEIDHETYPIPNRWGFRSRD